MFFELDNEDKSCITLGQLREFLNETCEALPDCTKIQLNSVIENEPVVDCIQVLADEQSVEFYNY